MIPVDPAHLTTVFSASCIAIDVLDILPQADLAFELKNIIETQAQIINCIMRQKHFGSDAIENFMVYLQDVNDMTKRLRKCH
jgi:hypothetical protein